MVLSITQQAACVPEGFQVATDAHFEQISNYLKGEHDGEEEDNEVFFRYGLPQVLESHQRGEVFIWAPPSTFEVKGFLEGNPKSGHMLRMEVCRGFRRAGIGSKLLDGFMCLAAKADCFVLHGFSGWNALKFWYKKGFAFPVGREGTVDALCQRLDSGEWVGGKGVDLYRPISQLHKIPETAERIDIQIEIDKEWPSDPASFSYTLDGFKVRNSIQLHRDWVIARDPHANLRSMRIRIGDLRTGWTTIRDIAAAKVGVEKNDEFLRIRKLDPRLLVDFS